MNGDSRSQHASSIGQVQTNHKTDSMASVVDILEVPQTHRAEDAQQIIAVDGLNSQKDITMSQAIHSNRNQKVEQLVLEESVDQNDLMTKEVASTPAHKQSVNFLEQPINQAEAVVGKAAATPVNRQSTNLFEELTRENEDNDVSCADVGIVTKSNQLFIEEPVSQPDDMDKQLPSTPVNENYVPEEQMLLN